jgi:hypothetical protein
LAGTGLGLGDVDDVEYLGTAEAGDLHGTHAREARAWSMAITAAGDAAGVIEPRRPGHSL